MNKMQKRIIVSGALVIMLMGLIPPWIYTFDVKLLNRPRLRPAGYSLIFTPPPPECDGLGCGIELDFKRLFVQWVITGIATGIGLALAQTKSKN